MAQWWYIDVGQVFLPSSFVSSFVELFDAELASAGATRGSKRNGDKVKSAARTFVGNDLSEDAWACERVRDRCNILSASCPSQSSGY